MRPAPELGQEIDAFQSQLLALPEFKTLRAMEQMCRLYDSSIYYILFKSAHSYTHSYTGNNYHSGSKHYYEYADICTGCGDQKANTTTWSVINCSGPPCIDIMNVGITQ